MESGATRRRWWALGALSISGLVIGIDLTVLNVALPTLAAGLHASTSDLQWFANAYNLVLAAALLPAGLLGDRFGRKRLLASALLLFGVASAACAYASSSGTLIAARALLGLGAAFVIPLCMSVLPVLFTAEERPRALTVWITANSVGIPLGPIVGGWLLNHFWWGSVFLINVPVVLIAVTAIVWLVPESRSSVAHRLDFVGVVLSAVGLVALTYGVIRAGSDGWGDGGTIGTLLAGAAVLGAFVLWQRRMVRRPGGEPLVDPALFKSATFAWGTVLITVVMFAMFGVMFAMPQFFQGVTGTDALGTGVRLLPLIGGLLVGARIADRVVPRAGAKVAVAIGFLLLMVGLGIGATTRVDSGFGLAGAWFALAGAGMGFAMPTAMGAAIGELTAERSGIGSAVIQAIRTIGGAIGVAILGTVLNSVYRGRLDVTGLPAPAAQAAKNGVIPGVGIAQKVGSAPLLASVRSSFTDALDVMLWACGGIALVGLVLTVVFLPRGRTAVGSGQADEAESRYEALA